MWGEEHSSSLIPEFVKGSPPEVKQTGGDVRKGSDRGSLLAHFFCAGRRYVPLRRSPDGSLPRGDQVVCVNTVSNRLCRQKRKQRNWQFGSKVAVPDKVRTDLVALEDGAHANSFGQ